MSQPQPATGQQIILAIETSQREGSVALLDARGIAIEEPLHEPTRYDDDLLPAIDRLMARCSLSPRDLDAVAVSIGPGGFTGLRIAISTAKMLGEALGLPLIAVPSALVAAASSRAALKGGGTIVVALASKRETAWITRVEPDRQPVEASELPAAITTQGGNCGRLDTWTFGHVHSAGLRDASTLDLAGVEAVLADEHFPPAMREACERAGVPIVIPTFRAAACLTIAKRMLAAGEVTDALHLLPLYPREPEAVTLWRARHGS